MKSLRIHILKLFLAFFLAGVSSLAQQTDMSRLIQEELSMTFPSIYFKNNSTDYAVMPYVVDSCFKYIANNVKDIVSYVIWRDSLEPEKLSKQRIKKLKTDLKKYAPKNHVKIESMGSAQKISRNTIRKADKQQQEYLLTLNSVLDVSGTHMEADAGNRSHIFHPRIWCWKCWKSGFHMDKRSREYRKTVRRKRQGQRSSSAKTSHQRRRLVWTGWRTGFHWSSPGKSLKDNDPKK